MGVFESEWPRPPPTRPASERRFQLVVAAPLILFTTDFGATLAGAARETSRVIHGVLVFPAPLVVWWANA